MLSLLLLLSCEFSLKCYYLYLWFRIPLSFLQRGHYRWYKWIDVITWRCTKARCAALVIQMRAIANLCFYLEKCAGCDFMFYRCSRFACAQTKQQLFPPLAVISDRSLMIISRFFPVRFLNTQRTCSRYRLFCFYTVIKISNIKILRWIKRIFTVWIRSLKFYAMRGKRQQRD